MRIILVSEMNLAGGSGYTTISRAVAAGLGERGHEVVALGLNYNGCEHRLPFTLLGAEERFLMEHVRQLRAAWKPDLVLGIADITKHTDWRALMELDLPYAGIFPLEAEPLISPSEWTRTIDTMAAALVETEWATKLCTDVGLAARHVPIGIDTAFWRPPSPEERGPIRERLGIGDRFVLLTVCDNHERKNLPAVFATAGLLLGREIEWPAGSGRTRAFLSGSKGVTGDDYYLIVNTKRRPEAVGYQLWDLAATFQLQNESTFYQHERRAGLTDAGLRDLYWAADCFLLLSKAEGLGLPVMEAMACGLPCVCTDTGGMAENLTEGRGWLVGAEYSYLDPFGNQARYFADPCEAAMAVAELRSDHKERLTRVAAALAWAKARTWAKALDVIEEAFHGIIEAKAAPEAAGAPPAGSYTGPVAVGGAHPG
ncbi:MAG: hypothetical protein A2V88_08905 [Elusimicrobia bacterium RBG_16_66_12]|nr:MAG: hypothetical protein A2V88_08905 [Elusimicrobia bacterium RBG_16_66_12]